MLYHVWMEGKGNSCERRVMENDGWDMDIGGIGIPYPNPYPQPNVSKCPLSVHILINPLPSGFMRM